MSQAAFYRGKQQFTVETIEAPAPAAGELQIEVSYCGICGTDLHVYLGHMDQRIGFERVIGHEMSGVVSAALVCTRAHRSQTAIGAATSTRGPDRAHSCGGTRCSSRASYRRRRRASDWRRAHRDVGRHGSATDRRKGNGF